MRVMLYGMRCPSSIHFINPQCAREVVGNMERSDPRYIKEYYKKNKMKWKNQYNNNKEKRKEIKKIEYLKHRDKYLNYHRNYYLVNKEKWIEYTERWKKENPEAYINNLYKQKSKRQRNLGFNKLHENPFEEPTDWHHVDDFNVVALPRDLHRLHLGKYHREKLVPIVEQIYGVLK